jgi:hypothetical protein
VSSPSHLLAAIFLVECSPRLRHRPLGVDNRVGAVIDPKSRRYGTHRGHHRRRTQTVRRLRAKRKALCTPVQEHEHYNRADQAADGNYILDGTSEWRQNKSDRPAHGPRRVRTSSLQSQISWSTVFLVMGEEVKDLDRGRALSVARVVLDHVLSALCQTGTDDAQSR